MIYIEPSAVDTHHAAILYRNVLSEGTLSASSETADGAAANALGPQTYDYWTPTSVPATLAVALSAAAECDACAIVAHNLGSTGATVTVQHYDGAAWVTDAEITPTDDSDILVIFEAAESDQWRIRVTTAVASIGVAMIGPRLLVEGGARVGYTPINLAAVVELAPSITVKGQYVGTFVKRHGAKTTVALALQTKEWVEDTAAEFIDHFNEGSPFIWASCPDLLERDLGYCWRAADVLQIVYTAGAQWAEISMGVQAYVGS